MKIKLSTFLILKNIISQNDSNPVTQGENSLLMLRIMKNYGSLSYFGQFLRFLVI